MMRAPASDIALVMSNVRMRARFATPRRRCERALITAANARRCRRLAALNCARARALQLREIRSLIDSRF